MPRNTRVNERQNRNGNDTPLPPPPENNPPSPPRANPEANIWEFILGMQATLAQLVRNQQGPVNNPPANDPPVDNPQPDVGAHLGWPPAENPERPGKLVVFERFKKLNPPSFKGTEAPEKAEYWLREMEKIFKVLGCTQAEQVRFGVYMLQDSASEWWDAHCRITPGGEAAVTTWSTFVTAFLKRFFPAPHRDACEAKFLTIKQLDSQTVSEYETEFNRLAKYARSVDGNDQARAAAFIRGLRPEISDRLTPLMLTEYGEAVTRALAVEINHPPRKSFQPITGKRDRAQMEENGRNDQQGRTKLPESRKETERLPPPCRTCGKVHRGVCLKDACYNCGEQGHIVRNCPKPIKERLEHLLQPRRRWTRNQTQQQGR